MKTELLFTDFDFEDEMLEEMMTTGFGFKSFPDLKPNMNFDNE